MKMAQFNVILLSIYICGRLAMEEHEGHIKCRKISGNSVAYFSPSCSYVSRCSHGRARQFDHGQITNCHEINTKYTHENRNKALIVKIGHSQMSPILPTSAHTAASFSLLMNYAFIFNGLLLETANPAQRRITRNPNQRLGLRPLYQVQSRQGQRNSSHDWQRPFA
jgi:hypothetical protein